MQSPLSDLAGRFSRVFPGAAGTLAPANQVTSRRPGFLGISFPFCSPRRLLYLHRAHTKTSGLVIFFGLVLAFCAFSVGPQLSHTLFVSGHDTIAAYACCVTRRLPWRPSTPGRNYCASTVRKSTARFAIMNLSLVDPFALAQDYPDTLTATLSRSLFSRSRVSVC